MKVKVDSQWWEILWSSVYLRGAVPWIVQVVS